MGWNGMVDNSRKGGGEVVRGYVGRRKVVWVVRWDMGSV